jgi:uncharacterized protein (DUF2141 family)
MQVNDIQPAIDNSISYLNLVADNIGKLTLKVFDTASGFIAKTINAQSTQVDELLNLHFQDLSNGTYIINAFSGDKFLRSIKFTKA